MKKLVIGAFLVLTMLSAFVLADTYVGEDVNIQLNMQCPEFILDEDISDGTLSQMFYEYELKDPDGVVQWSSDGLQPSLSETAHITCSVGASRAGIWECSGSLVTRNLTWTGTEWIVSGGTCDTDLLVTQEILPYPVCGNGIINNNEECDGTTESSCQEQGFIGGDTSCNNCIIDTSQCNNDEITEISLEPIKDAKVGSAQPTSRFGHGRYMMINDKGWAKDRSYLGFEIDSLPVSSAELSLYVYWTGRLIVGSEIEAWVCDEDFDEYTITWNNQPVDWHRYGYLNSGNCVLADTYTVDHRVSGGYPQTPHTWQLADGINEINSNSFTVVIKHDIENGRNNYRYVQYLAREYTSLPYRPHLEVSN